MRTALFLAALAFGLLTGAFAFVPSDPGGWARDLAVGMSFAAAGVFRLRTSRSVGLLLTAVGMAWFAGNLDPALWYWHRGPLVHLLIGQPRTRLELAAVVSGYVAAVVQPTWHSDMVAIVLVTGLLVLRRTGPMACFALLVYGGAAARTFLLPGTAIALPLAYQAGLVVLAAVLVWRAPGDRLTDRVIELSETGSLRQALAETVGDRSLNVGYLRDGHYYDDSGARLDPRRGTVISHEGRPLALIVHDPAALADPALAEAVAAAVRLSVANAALHAEIRASVLELLASRRRLLLAADEERGELAEQLAEGPLRRLAALPGAGPVLADLHRLALGLRPRELDGGLAPALRALARSAAVPVQLTFPETRLAPELEAAAYYVCAEALANTAKHARATRTAVRVWLHDGRLCLEITDDGVGGADHTRGTGLRGLADRVEALGGRLVVRSPPAEGTHVYAEFPFT
ncbi:ATP-binding protein [Nonomuraea dietziae]|uniref:ATP-binding protein n=1 Tax=Nonomuraea dietziae TaxID=65515 RepID=UPI0034283274